MAKSRRLCRSRSGRHRYLGCRAIFCGACGPSAASEKRSAIPDEDPPRWTRRPANSITIAQGAARDASTQVVGHRTDTRTQFDRAAVSAIYVRPCVSVWRDHQRAARQALPLAPMSLGIVVAVYLISVAYRLRLAARGPHLL